MNLKKKQEEDDELHKYLMESEMMSKHMEEQSQAENEKERFLKLLLPHNTNNFGFSENSFNLRDMSVRDNISEIEDIDEKSFLADYKSAL